MAANANEQNSLDAAEGLADLNRTALQDLPINREDEEMEGIAVNGSFDESDLLSTQFSSGSEAYRALQLDNERLCCSYRAVIQRVTKKEEGDHYIIDGCSNFRHNQRCQLRRCKRTTTVRRRILSKLKVVGNLRIYLQTRVLEYTNSFLSFEAISTPRIKNDFRLSADQTECCSN